MSYVQGTMIRLQADFIDAQTDLPGTPGEVICSVQDPNGTITTHALSAGQVQADSSVAGRYYYMLDSSPAAGTWFYQFASTGGSATVGRRVLTILSKIG
jgi:hypothetical protein